MTVFIWGITYIATKVLLTEFKPIEILFFRFTLGYATLWLLAPRFFAWQGIKQELMFLGAGFCGVTCYFLCENIALTYTTASNVGVITTLAPCLLRYWQYFSLKLKNQLKAFISVVYFR